MAGDNPLVAKAPAESNDLLNKGTGDNGWATGFSIAESAMDTFNGFNSGSWIEGGLGVVSLAADAASMAIDPFGTLMSSVASFLMEHVKPLKDALDWLAGNPPVIESYSTTWKNVAEELGKVQGDYTRAVQEGTQGWTGKAADAYRAAAGEHADALSGAASAAGSVGTVVGVMGMVVGFVRDTVRDLIADLVAKLIDWVMEEVFSLGFGTPVVVAQAVTAISKWATKIGELIQKLIKTIKKVSPMLGKLVEIFTKIMKVVGKLAGKVTGLDVISTKNIKAGGFAHKLGHGVDGPSGSHVHTGDGSHDSASSNGSHSDDHGDSTSTHRDDSTSTSDSSSSSTPDSSDSRPSDHDTSSSSAPSHSPDAGSPQPSHHSSNPYQPTHHSSGSSQPSHSSSSPEPTHHATNSPQPGHSSGGEASQPSAFSGPDGSAPHPAGGGGGGAPAGGPSHVGGASDAPGPRHAEPGADRTNSASATTDTPHRIDQPLTSTASSSSAPSSHPQQGSPAMGGGMPGGAHGGGAGGGSAGGAGSRSGSGGGWTGTPGSRGDSSSGIPSSRTPGDTAPSRTGAPTRPQSAAPGPVTPHNQSGGFGPTGTHSGPPQAGPPHGGPNGPGPHTRPGGRPNAPGRPDGLPNARARGDAPGGHPHSPNGAPHRDHDGPRRHPDHQDPHGDRTDSGPQHHDRNDPDGPHERHDPDPQHHGDGQHEPRPDPAEAHQRHAETTPSGVSHHRGDSDMGDLPHRVKDDPRYFTADVHITPDGQARIGNHTYSAEEYADMLRRSGWDGKKPIRLIGCDAGSNDFAKQLSRHLDAPVLAPNKPAWTDSHGRVFTSDAEVDAHGNRQPKIPPNGEWETHHPDGTKTKTGDDGYAPGSDHHGKDHDADGAKDRGSGREIPAREANTERRTPKASMQEKIDDQTYRQKYYDEPDAQGRIKRKDSEIKDLDGDPVPPVQQKGDRYVLTEEQTPEPPNYHDRVDAKRGDDVDPQLKRDNQELMDERRAENLEEKQAADGSPQEKAAQARLTKIGEEVGDRAGHHSVPEIYPGPPLPNRIDPGLGGSGRFDQVWETADGRLIVVETKGPSASLGKALGLDNKLVMQGHDRYFDKKIEDMKASEVSPTVEREMRKDLAVKEMSQQDIDKAIADRKAALKAENKLAQRLDAARKDPNHPGVEYITTQAKVKEMSVDEYLQKHHADEMKELTPEQLEAYKAENGYGDRYPDGRVDVYDGYVTKHFKMEWQ
jgi:hypothetical protein